ncbi:MAG: hypothetical protein QM784_14600 [Polyangiaceae bacterium]
MTSGSKAPARDRTDSGYRRDIRGRLGRAVARALCPLGIALGCGSTAPHATTSASTVPASSQPQNGPTSYEVYPRARVTPQRLSEAPATSSVQIAPPSELAASPSELAASPSELAGSDRSQHDLTTSLEAELLFRSGGGLHVPLELGNDGTIYVTTRQGYLDVLEADGRLRYSVTLGGIASGPLFVDERGSVFIATLAGTIVGFDAKGRKWFDYKPPIDIMRGLSFGDGVGLLVRGRGRVVLGINRFGVPVYRFEAPAELSAEPVGFSGFCVVATANGKLYFGNRALQRKPLAFTAAITDMQTTPSGLLWVRNENEFVALRANSSVAFRRSGIEHFYVFRKQEARPPEEGVLVDTDGIAHRVQADGKPLGTITLIAGRPTNSVEILASDGEGGLFGTDREGQLLRFSASSPPTRVDLDERPVGARLDVGRKRLLVGTSEGGIYAVTFRASPR